MAETRKGAAVQSTEEILEALCQGRLAHPQYVADALAAERDRADAMTALCDTNIESAQAWKNRADRAEARLAQILEYADSTYTASTVARRIVQMGKATS